MTLKLYENNSLLKKCQATVTACTEKNGQYLVELDQTVFFPEGGGQLSDRGKLGEALVSHVSEKAGHIYHECDRPLEPGAQVEASLDWNVRLDRMQQHCGEHILSYACWKLFGAKNVGFHMHEDMVYIDVDKELSNEELLQAEMLTNEIIWENRPIRVDYLDSSEAVKLKDKMRKFNDKLTGTLRIVSIEDADVCTCCGTHPSSTGMVGSVKVIRKEKHKGGCRIEFLCGRRALLDADKKNSLMLSIAESFSTKLENVEAMLAKQAEDMAQLQLKFRNATMKLLEQQVDAALAAAPSCANGARLLVITIPEGDGKEGKQLLPKVSSLANTLSLIMIVQPERLSYIVAAAPGTPGNCQHYIRLLNEAFGGRGGGKPDCTQGGSPYCDDWQTKLEAIKKQILEM